uniref:Uncharacterized protein n=1 Tax=Strombidium inclinatum TaxID=197538 RepID=A0A7S3J0J4_9SPIT|mmetsp:Transcript_7763/g.12027  ORF Transcript_7763/g.12027 Transcript_7763/m.12027 type:complete len:142 (+) Transcript_7763:182-607(+)
MPPNRKLMYNMNYFTLQLNQLTDALTAKLPPTDSRLRGDIRRWEHGDLEGATKEKTRLETNQRERRKKVRQLLLEERGLKKVDMHQEQEFYSPKFFSQSPDPKFKFKYTPIEGEEGYWSLRERHDWSKQPRIFEDDCEAFY